MKVVAFVPIKLNSERLPNKNILPFENGHPLVRYIQETLLKVDNIDDIFVYCSDEKIKDYLIPGIKFLRRDKYLDESSTPFNEVLSTFAKDVDADFYVLAHTTAPFVRKESIKDGVSKIRSGEYDSAVGVRRVYDFLWRDGKPLNYSLTNIPRTQDLPLIYSETCGMYIYSKKLILEENRRVGEKPYFVELSKIESIDINDKEDFIIANSVFNALKKIREV